MASLLLRLEVGSFLSGKVGDVAWLLWSSCLGRVNYGCFISHCVVDSPSKKSERKNEKKSNKRRASESSKSSKKGDKSKKSKSDRPKKNSEAVAAKQEVPVHPLALRRRALAFGRRDLRKLVVRLHRLDTYGYFAVPIVEPEVSSGLTGQQIVATCSSRSTGTRVDRGAPAVSHQAKSAESSPSVKSSSSERTTGSKKKKKKKRKKTKAKGKDKGKGKKKKQHIKKGVKEEAVVLSSNRTSTTTKAESGEAEQQVFVCEYGCGTENTDIKVVERHELTCAKNPSRTKPSTQGNDELSRADSVDDVANSAEDDEGSVAFVCEYGCGFERKDIAVVEEHELKCPWRKEGKIEEAEDKSKAVDEDKVDASVSVEGLDHESMFVCERGCGYEDTDIKVVEKHEETCSYVEGGSSEKLVKGLKKQKVSSGAKKKAEETRKKEEPEEKDPEHGLKCKLCFDFLFSQYEAGAYFRPMTEEEREDLQYTLPATVALDKKDETLFEVDFAKLEHHFTTMIQCGLNVFPESPSPKSSWFAANRILSKGWY